MQCGIRTQILGSTFMTEGVLTITYLGIVLYGWALADAAVRPIASVALFSSFSNILFIPPSKKYSWQTLWKWNQNTTQTLLWKWQQHVTKAHPSSLHGSDFTVMRSKTAAERQFVPATPFDASLSFAVFGPVVVSKILHGEGVLTQRLLILAVFTPDLVKVAHWEKKKKKRKMRTELTTQKVNHRPHNFAESIETFKVSLSYSYHHAEVLFLWHVYPDIHNLLADFGHPL